MRAKALALLVLAIFFIGLIVPFQTVGAERALGKLDPTLIKRMEGVQQPTLRVQGSSVFVFVRLNPGYAVGDVAGYMSAKFAVGPSYSPFAVYGTVSISSLLPLASSPAVSYVFPDVKLGFEQMKPDPEVYSQHLATDMFKVRQIIGADRVNQLGISGNGVTIAIVDTGTDFTIPDLMDAVARNAMGQAISFDADGQSFAITNLTVTRFGNVLATAGKVVSVWNAASYVNTSPSEPQIEKVQLHYNYVAPTVLSKSGYYHFGILSEEISDVISGETVNLGFPVVVVDAHQAGVYDTVVVDMSTAYYNFLVSYRDTLNSNAAQTLGLNLTWPSPNPAWDVHGFADEKPHTATPGNDLIYFDPNNTGVPVFSAGLLAYGVDLGGYTGKNFALLPPIDPNGNFINVFFDLESHGTSTASNAASRGILQRDIYQNGTLLALPGVAPAAKVMGVKALWIGDTTFAWYYAAGFDWDPTDFSFKYTGNHRADIISNSWGDSDPIADLGSTFGFDLMSQLADAFTIPHYLDPAYPGVVMLIAAGNGGYGYGTTASPGAATLPITVGASTSYAYRTQPGLPPIAHEIQGSYDEVVPWSARGPTSTGEPKPDVVDVGAFGFADQTTFTGYGNGTSAYTIFGGTSMATPVTAGAVALVIEEYRETHGGLTPAPDLVKAILASSATDLSYDQFTQGSGRVNVWDAVAAAAEGHDSRLPTRFYLYSPATWDFVKKLLAQSWAVNLQTPIPTTSSVSANWYAGLIQPGATGSATFDIQNAAQPTAQAYTYTLISSTTSQHTTNSTVTWIQIPKSAIPTNADLMKVTLVYHFSDFVNASSWSYSNLLLAQIYDTNFDSAGHISRITNGAPYSTTSELVVGRPLTKFRGIPAVRIVKQGPASEISFDLIFRYYTRSPWNWITQLSTSPNSLTATLTVPMDASPGVYGGFIGVSDNGTETVIPVSVMVPIVVGGTYGPSSPQENTPYVNFAVYGAFNWSWRYEAGDWRTFAIIVPPGVSELKVNLSWSDNQTLIQEHLTGPAGFLVASSEYPTSIYVSSGKFRWYTDTGGPAEDIAASSIQPGVYFLVLHNVLFGGTSSYPENYTLNVEMA